MITTYRGRTRLPTGQGWIAGVDGCPSGWMLVLAPMDGAAPPRLHVLPDLAGTAGLGLPVVALAVDMPIGLPDRIEGPGRAAERAVRALLGARQSSVFSIPVRAAVEAADYGAACAAAAAGSNPPRKVAKQAFNLFPKIRALDAWLRGPAAPDFPVVESHPEMVFRRLKGEPLRHAKKTAEGQQERHALLAAAGLDPAWLAWPAPRGAGRDDLTDAWACLLTARRVAEGLAMSYPADPPRDRFGLAMAIVV